MAFETKDNTGAAFKNTRKAADTHADYTGNARIDGHDYWCSVWINKDKNGATYFKLGFKLKDGTEARAEAPKTEAKQQSFARDLDDKVPF